ncbi:TonB-dependent receptor [Prosthecobacter fluviatilis]|uniref:TonB-dependent receptor n=1 Tax=Prosthecobacter fluviatilis TaxID=445931 RepID=A0ABW0KLE0_9BACT
MPTRIRLPLLLALIPGALFAESDTRIQQAKTAESHIEDIPLDEMVITAPLDRPLFQQAQAASILNGQNLTLALEPTLGQTLARMPGVSSSYFGPASSRPIIRGLDGDRVRILQNGLNTIDASATSVDHAVSFDTSNLKSVEVVRGPATLMYGSNAIGGVVNSIDGRIVDEKLDGTIRGALNERFTSVDNGYLSSAMIEGGYKGLAFHVEAFTRAAEDFRIPGNARTTAEQTTNPLPPGETETRKIIPNSNLRSEGITSGLSYVWDKGFFGFAWTEFHTNYGSPAEEHVVIDMHQQRLDVRGAFYKPFKLIKEINYKIATSRYQHTEFDSGTPSTLFKNNGYDARVEVKHEKIAGMEGVVGYQSDRSEFSTSGDEAFLPPTITQADAVFLYEDIKRGPVSFQFGGRYDHISVESLNSAAFGPALARTFDNLSSSVGIVFTPNDEYAVAFTINRAERAPTYQELFANGTHAATGAFEIGDPNLQQEKSLGFDLNLRKRVGWVTGSVGGYYNRYTNFIGQFPTGVVHVVGGESYNELVYQATNAEFIGSELEATFHLLHPITSDPAANQNNLHLQLRADVVRARDTKTGQSLPRIPPFHLSSTLMMEHGPFGARLEGIYAAPQSQLAMNESRTDSYFLVNLTLTYRIVQGPATMDFYVKGMNLTNEDAREHTSVLKNRVPLPGRGIVAGLKLTF